MIEHEREPTREEDGFPAVLRCGLSAFKLPGVQQSPQTITSLYIYICIYIYVYIIIYI